MNSSFTRQQIADLLGINKETLRFYEQEGIVFPRRRENGYREYDLDDMRMLIEIISYREAGFSLADAKTLAGSLTFDEAMESITRLIKERERIILREKEMLDFYKSILAPLEKVNSFKGTITLQNLGPWYRIGNSGTIDRSTLIEECYVIETWAEDEGGNWSISSTDMYRNSSAPSSSTAQNKSDETSDFIPKTPCVYTIVECESWTMESESLSKAAAAARNAGYTLSGIAYCLSISRHQDKGHAEIYFPFE
ncbi:MerR family transcriptional regulator [Adlercreutzia sp. R25]|uniref:MerR family transcriptional regulator n=1 Tax=Adlercreutzia shanghongiae TaxID=3111773 RepID=A0ABU6IXW2_9ACTN|nr:MULTISPECIES: MerR family transcriptional regulator [unclassified Adlercreutzia]MEC4272492.1 MerR family transcriptional regulator [Adlercreutzia sp. R25]MEC4294608.1 MerR family transcriptional regulator [Adlercreutzia sp. R22]